MRSDASNLPTPVLVGLPGAGKTTLTAAVAKQLGRSLFASDPFFRECRALPKGSSDPRRQIMEHFLERWRVEQPERYPALRRDADAIEAGLCSLHDGRKFRTHGEDAFRTYESELLHWAQANGLFKSTIPDLSASAPLRKDVQELFSPQNGYLPIFLDASFDVLQRNVLTDYARFCTEREAGNNSPIRGEFERDFDGATETATAIGEDAEQALWEEARRKIALIAEQRLATYREFARVVLPVSLSSSVEQLSRDILMALRDASCARDRFK